MTLQDAKKLRWGVPITPTRIARQQLHEHNKALFLGIHRNGTTIKVLRKGYTTADSYAPKYWKIDVDRL